METTTTVSCAAVALEDPFPATEAARLLASAKAAICARDEILAVVSHDLRAPLSAINNARQLIWRELLDLMPDDEGSHLRKHLDTIDRCTARMTRLANDLLDLASIESGRLSMRLEAHDIGETVRETLECFELQAAKKEIQLDGALDPGLPRVRFDKDRLLQLLGNLVSNALRFTKPRGSVHIHVRATEFGVIVSVRDTGKGMAPDALARLFDRHWQSTQRHGTGHGLGLAISKAIVEAHGGTISAESALGEGTTVSFTVPSIVL